MKKALIVIFYAFCLFSCGGNKSKNGAEHTTYEIKLPVVPAVIVTEQERNEYMAARYWDNFDFSDTAYISRPDVTEQAFVNYLAVLSLSSPDVRSASVKKMLSNAEPTPEMFDYFTGLYEKYLYDEGSPMRNDELYIPVLEYIVNSDKVDEVNKLRPQSQLKMALQNRVGQKANDFQFTTPEGKKMKLSDVGAFFTLLFIYNPDCSSCKEITQAIVNSPVLNTAIRMEMVKVLAIYPDENIEMWRNHLSEMPKNWQHGYDHALAMHGGLYDTKAIPSLYLLGDDKEVLVKDAASIAPIEAYFTQDR